MQSTMIIGLNVVMITWGPGDPGDLGVLIFSILSTPQITQTQQTHLITYA